MLTACVVMALISYVIGGLFISGVSSNLKKDGYTFDNSKTSFFKILLLLTVPVVNIGLSLIIWFRAKDVYKIIVDFYQQNGVINKNNNSQFDFEKSQTNETRTYFEKEHQNISNTSRKNIHIENITIYDGGKPLEKKLKLNRIVNGRIIENIHIDKLTMSDLSNDEIADIFEQLGKDITSNDNIKKR